MSKLAGRLSYLGSGILAGAAIAAAILKYETLSNIVPDNPQLWIAVITAITGALSAFAAFQVASIARISHTQATRAAEARLSTARQAIRNLRDALQEDIQSGASIFYKTSANIIFSLNAEHIGTALNAATTQNEYIALRRGFVACQTAMFFHEKNGHLTSDDLQGCIDAFDSALELFGRNEE